MDDLSERLREYQKLMWAAPMKVPGVYQAVPIDLLVEAIEALAAAPEPLRVAGEEVERLRDMANMFSEGEDIMIATSVMREHAADLRSVLALIDARPPTSEEVEKAAAWLEETVADYCDPDSAFRAAELLRRLALIEPSAGGGEKLFTDDEIRAHINRLRGKDTIRFWSIMHGLKPQQVEYFLRGERPLEPKIAEALGLERVTLHRYPPTPDQPKQEVKDV